MQYRPRRIENLTALCVACVFALVGVEASATLVITDNHDVTPAGYTEINPPGNQPLSDYAFEGGNINFVDGKGEALDPTDGDDWWEFSDETPDKPIFTTGLPSNSSSIWIDFQDVDVYGFSFHIGANRSAYGWFTVTYELPDGTTGSKTETGISIGPGNSPGFSVYSSGGHCARITGVHVDPDPFIWGIGRMAADTQGQNCVQVPEPSSITLLGFGILALGLMRRFQLKLR
jgi:hypothetical protein